MTDADPSADSDPSSLADMLGGLDLGGLIEGAQAAMAAQQAAAEAEVTGRDPNGLVFVTGTGAGQFRDVRIDPTVIDPSDPETLEDLVVIALRDFSSQVEALAQTSMAGLAGDPADLLGGLGLDPGPQPDGPDDSAGRPPYAE